MAHPAHQPTDGGLVEYALLRHETDATPVVQPGRPLHECEVQIAEMGHGDHGAAGRRQVLGTGDSALDSPETEQRTTRGDGRGVDRFAPTSHDGTSLLRGAGRWRSVSGTRARATRTVAASACGAGAVVSSGALGALSTLRAGSVPTAGARALTALCAVAFGASAFGASAFGASTFRTAAVAAATACSGGRRPRFALAG